MRALVFILSFFLLLSKGGYSANLQQVGSSRHYTEIKAKTGKSVSIDQGFSLSDEGSFDGEEIQGGDDHDDASGDVLFLKNYDSNWHQYFFGLCFLSIRKKSLREDYSVPVPTIPIYVSLGVFRL